MIKKLLNILTPQEKRKSLYLLLMIIVMAFFDMVGVASILPFMAVLADPGVIETNNLINFLYNFFSFKDEKSFFIFLSSLVFFLISFAIVFKALTTYFQLHFINQREYSISKRLVEKYLHHPYEWFIEENSSDLGKKILAEVGTIVSAGLLPLLTLISQSMISIAILGLLIYMDPKLALIVGITLFSFFITIFSWSSGRLKSLGIKRLESNKRRYISVSEAFGAIKEVKVGNLERAYISRFSKPAKDLANVAARSMIISQMPRFLLEGVAIGGIIVVFIYQIATTGNFSKSIPIITLYAFSGYRLMPALQQIYHSLSQLKYATSAIDEIYKDLHQNRHTPLESEEDNEIKFEKEVELKDINYAYPGTEKKILSDFNLTIKKDSHVAIIGASGSGKTTVSDILLGILKPQSGELRIDNVSINRNIIFAWQRLIGFVPQQIYLSDETIMENIGFGIERDMINMDAVENAAKIANVHNFIIKNLKDGYSTVVGERGIKLSGGQRQRIGLARALYHNPKILILDEATSALDSKTEYSIINDLRNLSIRTTVVLITHKVSTIKNFDQIILIKDGNVCEQGSYHELLNNNHFKELL